MLYATGDLHGDLSRFKQKEWKKLRRGDTLIVCGDFGFVWDGSKREQRILRWISRRRYRVLFVEGTHDNLDLLATYPLEEFCGGQARRLGERLWYLCRGECYELEGKRLFALGGGESADAELRIPGVSWWENELPAPAELAHARETLERCGYQVDYLITHECSATLRSFLDMDTARINPLGAFLEEVAARCRFQSWCFGCYHLDRTIPGGYNALWNRLLPLGGEETDRAKRKNDREHASPR